jgi:hypothetical protein
MNNKEFQLPIRLENINDSEKTEEWRKFYSQFNNLHDDVHDLIFGLESERKQFYFDKLQEQMKSSFASVENPRKYLTFHNSIGGTATYKDAPELDFEGEYSLYNFLQKLKEEIENEKGKDKKIENINPK